METPFVVEKSLSGLRVDRFLNRHLRNYTPYRLQRMIRAGGARRNCAVIDLETRVFTGQEITLTLWEPPDKLLAPEPGDLAILFEDPWLIVLNKPAGIVAHPVGKFQTGTLVNRVQRHLDSQTKLKGLLRPGIVHRLDRMTSGIMVPAKEHASHSDVSIQFQRGRVQKSYLAILEGTLIEDAGEINLAIGHAASRETVLMSTAPDARRPKAAKTQYEVLERTANRTLIRAWPRTGRIHQIRVHFAAMGHPVVGDEFYQAFDGIKAPAADREQRHFLHASTLRFRHPTTRETLHFQAPPPADFSALLKDFQRATA